MTTDMLNLSVKRHEDVSNIRPLLLELKNETMLGVNRWYLEWSKGIDTPDRFDQDLAAGGPRGTTSIGIQPR